MEQAVSRRAALFGIAALAGCAAPADSRPPIFPWGAPITFGGWVFDFADARNTTLFANWLNQPTYASNFVILDLTMTNTTGAAQPAHFQPIFRLRGSTGAIYEPSQAHTSMINFQKSGRVAPGAAVNPNTPTRIEIVFEVPRRPYTIAVVVPSRARVGFGGGIESRGEYFVVDSVLKLS